MKEAAERYSPEMAEAFQPTDTERPATKKSWAVLDLRAAQKPIQMVTATVTREKTRIQGSRCILQFGFFLLEGDGLFDENPCDHPNKREEQHAQDKPTEGESEDPPGHDFGKKVV